MAGRWSQRLIGLVLALGLLGGLAACSSDGPETTLDKVQETGVLRVGTEGTYSPFSYHDPASNALTGYDIEVVTAVAEEMGVTRGVRRGPVRLDLRQPDVGPLRRGGQPGDAQRRPRGRVRAVQAVHRLRRGHRHPGRRRLDHPAVGPEGQDHRPERDQQLGRGRQKAGAEVEAVEGFTQAITLVKQRRVDATVNDNLAVAEYTKTTNDTSVKIAAETGDTSEQVFALRPTDGELRDAMNTALDQVRADGTLTTISEKYFGTDVSSGDAGPDEPAAAPTNALSTWQLVA